MGFSTRSALGKFKPELLLEILNRSSGLHNIHTKDNSVLLGCKSFSLLHSEARLWGEVRSRQEPESEIKGLCEIPFLICFTLCLFPGGKSFKILQNEFEVDTNNAYD